VPLPAALLLDLDDTILDYSGAVEECWRTACRSHCPPTIRQDELWGAVKRVGEWFWSDPERHRLGRLELNAARAEVVRLALEQLGVLDPQLSEQIAATYARLRDAAIAELPDAIDTVRWLQTSGCRLALLTNGTGAAQRKKISQFALDDLFDEILIEGEVGFGKPDERIYRLALARLDVAPQETWMIGDNLEWDVAAPQQLGLFSIWVDTKGMGVPAHRAVKPDRIVRRLADLRLDVDLAVRLRAG